MTFDPITRDLGIISPLPQWQTYPRASAGSDVFRVTCQGRSTFSGWVELRFFYRNGDEGPTRRVYVKGSPQIINIPIPELLKENGPVERLWQIRFPIRWARSQLNPPLMVRLEEIEEIEADPTPDIGAANVGDPEDLDNG